MISQVLFTSEQLKKNKMAFAGILSQINLLFWPLVIQLVWYILKQYYYNIIHLSVGGSGRYLNTSTSVNNSYLPTSRVQKSGDVYNFCIVRKSLKTMSRKTPRKSPKRQSERPRDLMKNLDTPGKTGRVGRYVIVKYFVFTLDI